MAEKPEAGESITGQVGKGLTSNLVAAATTGIVSGIGAALLSAWGLVVVIPDKLGLTPSGAVTAFDLEKGCPTGWVPYNKGSGRFIIGAADTVGTDNKPGVDKIPGDFTVDKSEAKIEARAFNSHGGEQKHLLTVPEMPKHNHKQDSASKQGEAPYGQYPPGTNVLQAVARNRVEFGAYVDNEGGSQPHSIMPPYVALWWCRKE